MTLVDLIAEAKARGEPERLAALIPYCRWMGLSIRNVGGELLGLLSYSDMLIGNAALPALHGGTLGALLESAAIYEMLWRSETIVLPKTITLTVDYLRSGAAVDTHARCIVTRHGRRVTNVRMEAWQTDRATPVATAHAIFLVKRSG